MVLFTVKQYQYIYLFGLDVNSCIASLIIFYHCVRSGFFT